MKHRSHLRSVAAGAVATVAAIASYSHMRDLALTYGQPPYLAVLLPVSVDGMLVVASIVMAEDREAGYRPRPWARAGFWVGVVASVGANVLAAPGSLIARLISGWPAAALLCVVEMLTRPPRKRLARVRNGDQVVKDNTPEPGLTRGDIPGNPAPGPVAAVTVTPPAPTEPAVPPTDAGGTLERGTDAATPVATFPGNPLVVSLPSPDATLTPGWKVTGQSNAERVKLAAARLPADATLTEIAAAAKVSESTVRRHLPADHPLRNGKARKPVNGKAPARIG